MWPMDLGRWYARSAARHVGRRRLGGVCELRFCSSALEEAD
jgi:hypothetical protein